MFSILQCVQLLQSGQPVEAVQALNQRLLANAKDVETHHLLGVASIMIKEYKVAEKHLLKALKLQPEHLDAQYNLARLYAELKKHSKAKIALLNVLRKKPDWLQARFALGLSGIAMDDIELARVSFNKVLEVQPSNAEAWFNLGNIDYSEELYDEAKICYEKAVINQPGYKDALMAWSRSLNNLGQIEASIEMLEQYRVEDSSAAYDVQLAITYRLLGNKAKAHICAAAAIEKDPANGEAYRAYYESIKVKDIAELDMLQQALQLKGVDEEALCSMHFAMSAGLESCGEFGQAREHLDMANKLRRKTYSYSSQESVRLMNMLKKVYSKSNLERMLDQQVSCADQINNKNIFILGMPRSGTSLVEQIVASHSDVFGAGELSNLRAIWRNEKFPSEAKFHTQLIKKDALYWQQIGLQYMESVASLKKGESWLSDKMPHNFLMIGFIATIMPHAKIIHCKRNPVANCLSIYKASFSGSHKYAYNQKELAEYHNLYEDLMDHWRQVLPGRFYEIKYEELTSNQEQETRKLLEYCELPWEDACLDFHKNKRAVKTASAYQVRQSMHTKSVDLWKRYGDGLKPLIDNLYIPEEYQD